ncbi:hypothetical protein GCM10007199_22340 [Fictibacillus barbaricus]|nr:hypothetical protein GCM10007199_22340 [Fictibacillus barbaricus]
MIGKRLMVLMKISFSQQNQIYHHLSIYGRDSEFITNQYKKAVEGIHRFISRIRLLSFHE